MEATNLSQWRDRQGEHYGFPHTSHTQLKRCSQREEYYFKYRVKAHSMVKKAATGCYARNDVICQVVLLLLVM